MTEPIGPPTREYEVEFMMDPMGWPHVVLPIKRNGLKDVGFMIGDGPKIRLGNIWGVSLGIERLDRVEVLEYESFEAIYDDGWRVD